MRRRPALRSRARARPQLIAYAIFEGGGAKGISHVGALKAVEDDNIQLVGVAGTSAGAIVATLVAVGYTADELIDPELDEARWTPGDPWNVFLRHGESPIKLVGDTQWDELIKVFDKLRRGSIGFAATAYLRYRLGRAPRWLDALLRDFGVLDSERARAFLNERLLEKVGQRTTVDGGIVRFRHLSPALKGNLPLKLVVTDTVNRALVLVDSTDPDVADIEVAAVVVASMSIPLLFPPRDIDGVGAMLVDGGLVGNLPVWAFLEDRVALQRKLGRGTSIPTIAFLSSGARVAARATSIDRFAVNVGYSGVFGSQRQAIALVPGVVAVDLDSDLATTVFNPDRVTAMAAYRKARTRTAETLDEQLRDIPDEAAQILDRTLGTVRRALISRNAALAPRVASCRLALLSHSGRSSVRVLAAVNRAGDGDEDLVYDIESPAAPAALALKEVHHYSFASSTAASLRMTPSEFARQPSRLQSLVAVPIFETVAAWGQVMTERDDPAGILVLDADFDLRAEIVAGGIEDDLITQSTLLFPLLARLANTDS